MDIFHLQFEGLSFFPDRKKCPPTWLHALGGGEIISIAVDVWYHSALVVSYFCIGVGC